jgi:hypothetical protein
MKSKDCFDLHLFYNWEVGHFFIYLLAICTPSYENSLLNSCAHFFNDTLLRWRLRVEFPVHSGY